MRELASRGGEAKNVTKPTSQRYQCTLTRLKNKERKQNTHSKIKKIKKARKGNKRKLEKMNGTERKGKERKGKERKGKEKHHKEDLETTGIRKRRWALRGRQVHKGHSGDNTPRRYTLLAGGTRNVPS